MREGGGGGMGGGGGGQVQFCRQVKNSTLKKLGNFGKNWTYFCHIFANIIR